MLIRRPEPIKPSEITPRSVYQNRRQFLGALGGAAALSMAPGTLARGAAAAPGVWPGAQPQPGPSWLQDKVASASLDASPIAEPAAPWSIATGYNNFYEFGGDKRDPAMYASEMTTDPWSVEIKGEVAKPGTYALEDVLAPHDLEERIYRLRCVEAWSMVIPWIGFPLRDLLARFEPTSDARYVEFTTLKRPSEMRGQRSFFATLDYPYVEGLRFDEAMHPLAFLAVGMYGEALPNQNGAPLRLVVPWKYGFKSIKSIVKIRLVSRKPETTWNLLGPREYGFYANVNPEVSHPRWSQATERRLPSTVFEPNRRDTLMFNGYGEEVASLYAGMDLRRNY